MIQSYHRKPSLDNAYARVRRAKQHLTWLKSHVTALQTEYWHALNPEPSTTSTTPIDVIKIENLPPITSIRIGECVYNLRAALDYLVYELAILDSGQIQEGTQFPIEDTEKGWKGRRSSYLKGVSIKHQTILQSLQPYMGCQWTGTLKSLSNPDKHRSLLVKRANIIYTPNISKAPSALGTTAMEMESNLAFHVTFDDRSPVIETLHKLQAQVAQIIDTFNPEFEG